MRSLTVSGAAATDITAGEIVNTTIHANSALTEISLGHDHLEGERAATVVVTEVTLITTLNLSTVNKIKTVTVSGNASLTALTESPDSLLLHDGLILMLLSVKMH